MNFLKLWLNRMCQIAVALLIFVLSITSTAAFFSVFIYPFLVKNYAWWMHLGYAIYTVVFGSLALTIWYLLEQE